MKYSHNKKRNTAFVFEVLIRELTKASLNENAKKKQGIVGIITKYFSKGKLLKEDLEIYKSIITLDGIERPLQEKILSEAKKQFTSLDREKIFKLQNSIIQEINNLDDKMWNNFVPNYKNLATINQVLMQKNSPKKQVLLEQKILSTHTSIKKDNNKFPKVNNLAMKNFVEKFNEKYSSVLSEDQKRLVFNYVNSTDENNLEFKVYLYEQMDNIKSFLSENKNSYDDNTSSKIQKVLEKIETYRERKLDESLIFDIFRIQSVVKELQRNVI